MPGERKKVSLKKLFLLPPKSKQNIVNSILLYNLLYCNAMYYNNALSSRVNVFLCICILRGTNNKRKKSGDGCEGMNARAIDKSINY